MSSRLLEIRKAAGYATAREFAEASGLAESTYTRYESNPERIPLKVAWDLADRFHVTIDQVVGRDTEAKGDPRGAQQRAFDALSPRSQEEAADFMAYLAERDARSGEAQSERARRVWEVVSSRIERAYLGRLSDGPDPVLLTGSDAELREGFRELARTWVVGAERPLSRFAPKVRGEEALKEVMAVYDRMHGSFVDDHGVLVSWSQETGPGYEGGGIAGR
jgi:transcriptional regulator with XRE-family HTH domain